MSWHARFVNRLHLMAELRHSLRAYRLLQSLDDDPARGLEGSGLWWTGAEPHVCRDQGGSRCLRIFGNNHPGPSRRSTTKSQVRGSAKSRCIRGPRIARRRLPADIYPREGLSTGVDKEFKLRGCFGAEGGQDKSWGRQRSLDDHVVSDAGSSFTNASFNRVLSAIGSLDQPARRNPGQLGPWGGI